MSGAIIHVVRRLVVMCVLLVLVSFGVFALLYIGPGNPVDILLPMNRTPEMVQGLREQYHLDDPFLTQYWIWAREAAQFHFGDSIQSSIPVSEVITARLPVSLFLGVYAFIVTMVLGVGLGIVSAVKRRSVVDRGIVAGAIVSLSTPVFVSGVLLIYLFGIVLAWFPTFGRGNGFGDDLWHLTLPALALGLNVSAYVLRHTRAAMIGVLDQDYIVFARARGLSWRRILFSYSLRNALIPVVTISGILLSFLIVGAVLVEITFSLPGVGSLLVQAAVSKDLPLLQGLTMVIAVVIMGANLLADLAYLAVDPRIRLGGRPS